MSTPAIRALVREIQTTLKARGHHLGTTGPNRDGVDGDPGLATFTAIAAELRGGAPAAEAITLELLAKLAPLTPRAQLEAWVAPLRAAACRFGIDTPRRVGAWLAQLAHECCGFSKFEESLYYRPERLMTVWPKRFPTLASAEPYARNPEKLANKVYANRMGNGDEASGDGWRFRGGTPIHLTGRDNWTACATALGLTVDEALARRDDPAFGALAAAWFWEANDINRLADTPGVTDESRAVNGGDNGLADRARLTALAFDHLGVAHV